MSSEKTEKATPKRREDARKKGQIARGAELPAAMVFFGSLFVLKSISTDIFSKFSVYFQSSAHHIFEYKTLTQADVQVLMIEAVKMLAILSIPVMIVGFVMVLVGNFLQGGISLTPEALMPKADRFNPVNNIKKIFGTDSVVNLLKAVLKLSFIAFVSYGVLTPIVEVAPTLVHAPVGTVAVKVGETIYNLAFRCGMVFLTLAAADYGYTLYKHEKSLKMSKQEIRDEYKQQEGDPMIKNKRRNAARSLIQQRSLAQVPTANVIVTNPTHFSVALRYDREKDAAPIVVAKGVDNIAKQIREIAKENNIPLFENPPLARALYATVEPNQIIPTEFFGAVAEVLAFVFKQKEGR